MLDFLQSLPTQNICCSSTDTFAHYVVQADRKVVDGMIVRFEDDRDIRLVLGPLERKHVLQKPCEHRSWTRIFAIKLVTKALEGHRHSQSEVSFREKRKTCVGSSADFDWYKTDSEEREES